jgi:hypothetical protein
MTNLIGSRKESPIWNLEEIVMSPAEIAVQERLEASKRSKKFESPVKAEPIMTSPKVINNPIKQQGMIYVPSLDLYVSENRILHGKDWNDQTAQLHSDNKRMPTIPEFIGFVNYLRSSDGQKAVPNYQKILDEIYKVGGSWRSEYLDASFVKKKDGLYVAYHKFDSSGKIIKTDEKLDAYQIRDKTPGIDLAEWLSSPTRQGLPKSNISNGDLYYWSPVEGRVAGFDAYSDRASLDCDRGPSYSSASLGVRFVGAKNTGVKQ